ncbi:hypothetical protein V1477_011654 [Vespula maculifrons]|uniref:Uncharacterized protein n=1 Tax=Vespula maculifrons TaxID=7453 RepID=A0ABD2C0D6_VESMC
MSPRNHDDLLTQIFVNRSSMKDLHALPNKCPKEKIKLALWQKCLDLLELPDNVQLFYQTEIIQRFNEKKEENN